VDLLGGLIAKHRSGGGAVVAASHVPLPGEWRPLELGR
jgi:ABC-type transport system involved in cytochrome c biogenesis ATPase subunit